MGMVWLTQIDHCWLDSAKRKLLFIIQLSGFRLNWEKTLHIRVLITKGPPKKPRDLRQGFKESRGRVKDNYSTADGPECQKSVAIISGVHKIDLHFPPWTLES